VSAGNFKAPKNCPQDWRGDIDYSSRTMRRIIDPAPALNVLTVGSLARHRDLAHGSAVFQTTLPTNLSLDVMSLHHFSNRPGHGKAIKPELSSTGAISASMVRFRARERSFSAA